MLNLLLFIWFHQLVKSGKKSGEMSGNSHAQEDSFVTCG